MTATSAELLVLRSRVELLEAELKRLRAELTTERAWREELQFLSIDQAVEIERLKRQPPDGGPRLRLLD